MSNPTTLSTEAIVTPEMLACHVGSGSLPVLATPMRRNTLTRALPPSAQSFPFPMTLPLPRARTSPRRPLSSRRRDACSASRWKRATTRA